MLWEPKMNIGAGLVNGPGLLSWNDLASPDVEASKAFYGELFGWTYEQFSGGETPYSTIQTAAGKANGGMREPQPSEPPHWGVYFGTDDVASAMAYVEQLGGSPIVGPMSIGIGTIGVVSDPQGAVFSLYSGEFED
jgi:hypothetical protein